MTKYILGMFIRIGGTLGSLALGIYLSWGTMIRLMAKKQEDIPAEMYMDSLVFVLAVGALCIVAVVVCYVVSANLMYKGEEDMRNIKSILRECHNLKLML